MSKRKAYKPKGTSIPMLINRKLEENVESMEENAMILAFRFGAATKENYDYLVRMTNMMCIAEQLKPSKGSTAIYRMLKVVSALILARYNKTGKFGVTGVELQRMKECVENYDLYWKQQTTTFYNQCVAELNAFYADLEQNRKAA